jgi:RHS repeat-associated protein
VVLPSYSYDRTDQRPALDIRAAGGNVRQIGFWRRCPGTAGASHAGTRCSVAATTDSADALSSALRYDGYGQTQSSWTASGPQPTPWRYQGRLELSPDAANPLYENGARSYSPGLGVFTQLDSYTGSAQNPLSMNRYLYAEANPATLIDPSGHFVQQGPDSDLADSHLAPGTGGGQQAPVYQPPAYQPPPPPSNSGPQKYADPGGASVNPWPDFTADQYQSMSVVWQENLIANYGAAAFAAFFSTSHPWDDPFMIALARDYLRFHLYPWGKTSQRYLPQLDERAGEAMFNDAVFIGDAASNGAVGISAEIAGITIGWYSEIGERVAGNLRGTIPQVGSGGG